MLQGITDYIIIRRKRKMDERDVNYLKSKIENKENQLDTYMKIR